MPMTPGPLLDPGRDETKTGRLCVARQRNLPLEKERRDRFDEAGIAFRGYCIYAFGYAPDAK